MWFLKLILCIKKRKKEIVQNFAQKENCKLTDLTLKFYPQTLFYKLNFIVNKARH